MSTAIDSLTPADHDAATELLVDAFFDNPAHVYILPDEATRRRRLRWLMRRNLAVQHALGRGDCLRSPQPGLGLDAMSFCQPPGSAALGGGLLVRHGFGLAPLRIGVSALRRLLEVVERIEAQRLRVLAGTDAWTLHDMVVRKELRGSGVGRRLLKAQLERSVDPSGRAAVLATQRPANVRFYQQQGFEVASETSLGDRRTRFLNWILLRPAAH